MPTNLFPIKLEGSGTAEVESLASYVYRMAYEHGVFVGEFLKYIGRRNSLDRLKDDRGSINIDYVKASEMVRVNRMSESLMAILSHETGQYLEHSRFLFMSTDVWRSPREIVKGFRWCQECMSEWKATGQTPYFKLTWHLSEFTHCTLHRTKLVSKCSFCGCNQVTYKRVKPLEYCQICGNHLASVAPGSELTDLASTWEQKGADLHQLFIDIAKYGASVESFSGGIWLSLREIFNHFWDSRNESHMYQAFPRDEWISIYHKQRPISIRTARRISYGLGIDLYTLMSGNAMSSSQVLNETWLCELPDGFCDRQLKKNRNHREILEKLKIILDEDGQPRSAKDIARDLDVSVGYLRHRHPTILAALVERYQAFIAEERRQKRLRAKAEALRYFTGREFSEFPKSRKQAYIFLRNKTGLPKFLLKRAIDEVYEAL
ncbi:TniQ family protein [Alcanivorax sp. 1008]|uniref:TniQ family protein n=1 Tax=Alcanivorax sp. 1008 TaxID=2816853 RepID=UPI001DAAC5ED|nr:TniQ family protein [Alcanivorax sp. 1008]MCC1498006.1 TniQ family protein [Alcanivorax sp. 1008]